jgi:hypothetical protein
MICTKKSYKGEAAMYLIKKDVVAIDHAQLDTMVVEEGIMKRPWLTVAMDLQMRNVLDMHISLSPPSAKPDSATTEVKRRIEERLGPIVWHYSPIMPHAIMVLLKSFSET